MGSQGVDGFHGVGEGDFLYRVGFLSDEIAVFVFVGFCREGKEVGFIGFDLGGYENIFEAVLGVEGDDLKVKAIIDIAWGFEEFFKVKEGVLLGEGEVVFGNKP